MPMAARRTGHSSPRLRIRTFGWPRAASQGETCEVSASASGKERWGVENIFAKIKIESATKCSLSLSLTHTHTHTHTHKHTKTKNLLKLELINTQTKKKNKRN